MFFRTVAFSAFVASFASAEVAVHPGAKLSATSKAGERLLSKARKLNGNDERDVTFVAKYDIKYMGCSSLIQFRGEEGGGDEGFLYSQNLVKFSLCPSDNDSCSDCRNGADYVVNMMDFVQAYTQYKEELQEQACENVAENCGNDDEYNCYMNAGMEECIENENEEEFNVEEYLECAEMQNQNDNGNNNNQYFVGPYCSESDGWSIHLGIFSDEGCSSRASSEIYSNANYGNELPYSSEAIVDSDCISCKQVDEDNDNNNNNNQNQNNNYYYQEELEVNELCGDIYEQAAKCEKNLEINYKDTSSCEYIENILPSLESAVRSKYVPSSRSSGGNGAATAFAWIFAITSTMFGAYAYFLYGKLTRRSVDLNSSDGALA